jgi:hypothetical protein
MADVNAVELLKSLLQREVERFCRRLDPLWRDIPHIVEAIQRNHWRAVFFGGTLRSLLMSRLIHGQEGRPRDVDIVIQGPPLNILRKLFAPFISRETRFGGFHLHEAEWDFDVWPLEKTWGIVQDRIDHPDFAHLPYTTFLNIEAAAIGIWPQWTGERQIYSGDDQFFRAIINRVVEVNRAENPFPALCVVRSLLLVNELGFAIGPRLARYIADHGPSISETELETVQRRHYGTVRVPGELLLGWISSVSSSASRLPNQVVQLADNLRHKETGNNGYPYDFLRTVQRWTQGRIRVE